MKNWLRKLEEKAKRISDSKLINWTLFSVNLADSTIIPSPTTPFFLSVSLLNRKKSKQFAIYAFAGTITGAVISFLAGHFACINQDGGPAGLLKIIFDLFPGFSASMYAKIHLMFSKWNLLVFFVISLTSAPYGLFSFVAGALKLNFMAFLTATIVSQGLRFFFLMMITNGLASRLKQLIKQITKTKPRPAFVRAD